MTSTRHWSGRGRQRSRPGSSTGRVIPWPVSTQEVLFVCDPGGCSAAVAAAFFDLKVGPLAQARALAAHPGPHPITAEVELVMAELGIDVSRFPIEPIEPEAVRRARHLVVLGTATRFEGEPGSRGRVERWPLDEPADRGIEGMARLRLIRDGIESNVNTLVQTLGLDASSR